MIKFITASFNLTFIFNELNSISLTFSYYITYEHKIQ